MPAGQLTASSTGVVRARTCTARLPAVQRKSAVWLWLTVPDAVWVRSHWVSHWFSGPHHRRQGFISIKINDDFMATEIDGSVIAPATCAGGERWIVYGWPRQFSRERAITALVLANRFAAGHGDDDRFVIGWRQELR